MADKQHCFAIQLQVRPSLDRHSDPNGRLCAKVRARGTWWPYIPILKIYWTPKFNREGRERGQTWRKRHPPGLKLSVGAAGYSEQAFGSRATNQINRGYPARRRYRSRRKQRAVAESGNRITWKHCCYCGLTGRCPRKLSTLNRPIPQVRRQAARRVCDRAVKFGEQSLAAKIERLLFASEPLSHDEVHLRCKVLRPGISKVMAG